MAKVVPTTSFRRPSPANESAVTAFVNLGDAPGNTPPPPAALAAVVADTAVVEASGGSMLTDAATTTTMSESPGPTSPPAGELRSMPVEARRPSTHWRRKTFVRADGRELRKQTVYLDAELSHTLEVACAQRQYELSEAIEEAVRRWLSST